MKFGWFAYCLSFPAWVFLLECATALPNQSSLDISSCTIVVDVYYCIDINSYIPTYYKFKFSASFGMYPIITNQ